MSLPLPYHGDGGVRCWPYRSFASSDDDDDDIVLLENEENQRQQSCPVDVDDYYPSDEEDEPIEVTEDEFNKTVMDGKRSRKTNKKSMGKRIGNMLKKIGQQNRETQKDQLQEHQQQSPPNSPRRQSTNNQPQQHSNPHRSLKNNNNNDNNHETLSISGISAQSQQQQSVANKTVDSFASTIKASNRQDPKEDDNDETNGKKKDGPTPSAAALTAYKLKHSKTWKKLKKLVKGGQNGGGSKDEDETQHRQRSLSYEGGGGGNTSSLLLLQSAYPLRHRVRSEEEARLHRQRTPNTATGGSSSNVTSTGGDGGGKSLSWGGAIWRKRASSQEDDRQMQLLQQQQEQQHYRRLMDRAIRGRLDGADVLCLGPACRSSLPDLPAHKKKKASSGVSPHLLRKESGPNSSSGNGTHLNTELDPLRVSFTDMPSFASPSDLVADMIWMSAGQEHAEIVLEGFCPGGSDRWTVRFDDLSSNSSAESSSHLSPPTLKSLSITDDESTTVSSTEDGSTTLPPKLLWSNLWGNQATPPPIPSHMQTGDDLLVLKSADSAASEDLQHKFAASCNVPIDLDDDAFIIDRPEHFQSVHELIMVPIQARRFDTAIGLFQKLLRGLESAGGASDQERFEHLIGATHHNIGMMHLCQAHYGDALRSFQKAVKVRKQCLPTNHPDIAISLIRRGMAYLALNNVNEALNSFEAALNMSPDEDATRAKILSNLGVAHYQNEDYAMALKSFTSALEIQRQWLDGPVRREALVYDASITLASMGKCYLRKGDYDLAYFVFEEACLLQTSHFRKDHDIILTSQDNMARVQVMNGNHAEALRIFSSLARSQESRFGANSEACMETVGMMGLSHFKLLEFEEAESCLKRVSTWQSKHLNRSHPAVKNTKELLKQVQRCLKGDEPIWL